MANVVVKIAKGEWFDPKWDGYQGYLLEPDAGKIADSNGHGGYSRWRSGYVDAVGRANQPVWIVVDQKFVEPKVTEWGEESL